MTRISIEKDGDKITVMLSDGSAKKPVVFILTAEELNALMTAASNLSKVDKMKLSWEM